MDILVGLELWALGGVHIRNVNYEDTDIRGHKLGINIVYQYGGRQMVNVYYQYLKYRPLNAYATRNIEP